MIRRFALLTLLLAVTAIGYFSSLGIDAKFDSEIRTSYLKQYPDKPDARNRYRTK